MIINFRTADYDTSDEGVTEHLKHALEYVQTLVASEGMEPSDMNWDVIVLSIPQGEKEREHEQYRYRPLFECCDTETSMGFSTIHFLVDDQPIEGVTGIVPFVKSGEEMETEEMYNDAYAHHLTHDYAVGEYYPNKEKAPNDVRMLCPCGGISNPAFYCCNCGMKLDWHEMRCYLCYLDEHGKADMSEGNEDSPLRRVVGNGPIVEPQRDPTQSYKLSCGHTII